METPTAKEVALLNSCLRTIAAAGSDLLKIAKHAGVSYDDARRALDVLEADGIIYSSGRARKRYRLRADPAAGIMPWCDQCDCYHYTNAPCVDEIR